MNSKAVEVDQDWNNGQLWDEDDDQVWVEEEDWDNDRGLDDDDLHDIFSDWSGTGRGSHVEFSANEKVPLQKLRLLGHGAMGSVHRTRINGHLVAWKEIYCRRAIAQAERTEINILKKLSHAHIVRLVGTYTHRNYLGLLIYPVATCDLATVFKDLELLYASESSFKADKLERRARIESLVGPEIYNSAKNEVSPDDFRQIMIKCVTSRVGCLVSAINYLHQNKIRHKDLKPSNILLSWDGIWLTDFGSATDFSLRSSSQSDNREGTPKYFAPEVEDWQPSGRAADMFALGCILLEIQVLYAKHNLRCLDELRPQKNGSYQANLTRRDEWLALVTVTSSPGGRPLLLKTMELLSKDPSLRPTSAELLTQLAVADEFNKGQKDLSLFRGCCERKYATLEEYIATDASSNLNSSVREPFAGSANLRVGSIVTSNWLSQGRILFSPAYFDFKDPKEDRMLVIDGLGKDWSYYCALAYPNVTVYNLETSSSPSASASGDAFEPSPTPPNYRHFAHSSSLAAYPFPDCFFACVALRFPPALPSFVLGNFVSECARVLRPGGYFEFSRLDFGLIDKGNLTRHALNGISTRYQEEQGQSFYVRYQRDLSKIIAGSNLFFTPIGRSKSFPVSQSGPFFSDLLYTPSEDVSDDAIEKMAADVGRWWYSRCYESKRASNTDETSSIGLSEDSIWDNELLLKECEERGTTFRFSIGYAQKPEVGVGVRRNSE